MRSPDCLPSQDLEAGEEIAWAIEEIAWAIEEYRQNVNPPPEV